MTWDWGYLFTGPRVLSHFGVILSIIVACVVWPRSTRTPGARSFAWWLVLGAGTNTASFLFSMNKVNNHTLYHWYDLLSAMLLSAAGYRLLTEANQRRGILVGAGVFAVIWVALTIGGDGLEIFSKYTSPLESFVGVCIGTMLVAESIRMSSDSPWARPEAWLGIGLVLACAPALGASPIVNALTVTSTVTASLVYKISASFNYVALVIWATAYWKRSVVWTR